MLSMHDVNHLFECIHSFTLTCFNSARKDINPSSFSDDDDDSSIEVQEDVSQGGKSSSVAQGKRDMLAIDKNAARRAAVNARNKRLKNASSSEPKNRVYPAAVDLSDAATVMSQQMMQGTNSLKNLIEQSYVQQSFAPLQNSTRHNSPPSTPKKRKADDVADVNAIDEKIKKLKQEKLDAEAENDEDEVVEILGRIKKYKKLREDCENDLFGNQRV